MRGQAEGDAQSKEEMLSQRDVYREKDSFLTKARLKDHSRINSATHWQQWCGMGAAVVWYGGSSVWYGGSSGVVWG